MNMHLWHKTHTENHAGELGRGRRPGVVVSTSRTLPSAGVGSVGSTHEAPLAAFLAFHLQRRAHLGPLPTLGAAAASCELGAGEQRSALKEPWWQLAPASPTRLAVRSEASGPGSVAAPCPCLCFRGGPHGARQVTSPSTCGPELGSATLRTKTPPR